MGDLSKIRDKMKEMNEKIKDLLDKYDNIKYPEIRKRIEAITTLKVDLMDELPEAFGLRFATWYNQLKWIDDNLDKASDETRKPYTDDDEVKARIKQARKEKEALEKRIKEKNPN